MRFHVKNRFIYNGIKKQVGEIVEVSPDKINELKKANVLGEPIKEVEIETATIKPKEKQVIRTSRGKKKK